MVKAAEKTVERKAVQKTRKETGEAFDSTFNNSARQNGNYGTTRAAGYGMTNADPAPSYSFDYKTKMVISSGKDVMDVDYFLPQTGGFLCAKIKDKKIKDDFYTVFDVEREAMFTYMKNDGRKMKMGVAFKMDDAADEPDAVTIMATGNTRTILGYSCQEYKMEGKDMTGTVWVTTDVDIRFPSTLYKVKQNKSNNQEWMKDIDGWAMEVEIIDSSRRKPQTITMKCLSIESSDFRINSSEYQNIGF